MSEPQAMREMPRYRCHKEVRALRIADVKMVDGKWMLSPVDNGFAPFEVPFEYVDKHKPQVGGYYVVYADGYASFSPAKAFEEGYTLIMGAG